MSGPRPEKAQTSGSGLTSLLFSHGFFAWILPYSSFCAAKILSEQIAASKVLVRKESQVESTTISKLASEVKAVTLNQTGSSDHILRLLMGSAPKNRWACV